MRRLSLALCRIRYSKEKWGNMGKIQWMDNRRHHHYIDVNAINNLMALSDGWIGFGLDADCHYMGNVKLIVHHRPFPEPGTLTHVSWTHQPYRCTPCKKKENDLCKGSLHGFPFLLWEAFFSSAYRPQMSTRIAVRVKVYPPALNW